jgi:hypothetical protein
MTKEKMIKTIQLFEAKAFLRLKTDERLFGEDDKWTSKSRSRWIEIESLMTELGIKPDITLSENQEALEIIRNRINQETVN